MHPAGVFTATVLDHGIGETKNGNPQVMVLFETEKGTIFGYFVLTDEAAKWTLEKVRNMGFMGDDLMQLNQEGLLAGNKCDITVDHETYDDKLQAKVGWVNRVGEAPGTVDRDPVAAKNAKRYNAMLKKMKPKAPKEAEAFDKKPPTKPEDVVTHEDPPDADDCPI